MLTRDRVPGFLSEIYGRGGKRRVDKGEGGSSMGPPPPKCQVVSVTKLVFVVCQSRSANLCVPLKATAGLA